jgi:hypothetical protein
MVTVCPQCGDALQYRSKSGDYWLLTWPVCVKPSCGWKATVQFDLIEVAK